MTGFARIAVDRRQRLHRPARGGHLKQPRLKGIREEDRLIREPARAEIQAGRRECDRRATTSGHLFELSACKESNPASIRRKKWVLSVFGARQCRWLQLIDRLDEQLAAIASAGDIHEL